MEIAHFLQVDELIASSGQPGREEFGLIASSGYVTVVNLALPTSEFAIADEGALVTAAGMNYFHIPVEWQAPKQRQFDLFARVMNSHLTEKVWVHCALNMRTSCFLYLYLVLHRGVDKRVALDAMNQIWECNEIWSAFIKRVEEGAR